MIIKPVQRDPIVKKEFRLPTSLCASMAEYRDYYLSVNGQDVDESELLAQFIEFVTSSDKAFQKFRKDRERGPEAKSREAVAS